MRTVESRSGCGGRKVALIVRVHQIDSTRDWDAKKNLKFEATVILNLIRIQSKRSESEFETETENYFKRNAQDSRESRLI